MQVLSPEQQSQVDNLLGVAEKIRGALLQEDPQLPEYLVWINKELRQYPELLHLLNDDQIAPIYQGYMKVANVKIAVSKSRGNKSSDKAKQTGLLDDGSKAADFL